MKLLQTKGRIYVPIQFPFYQPAILFSKNSLDKTAQSLFQPF